MAKKDHLDKAREKTDKILQEMEDYLTEFYRQSEKEIRIKWDAYMVEQAKKIKDLQEEYEKAKESGDKDEIRKLGIKLSREKQRLTIQNRYYKEMVEEVTNQIAHVNETAIAYVNSEIPNIYVINSNGAKEHIREKIDVIKDKIDVGIRFDLMDEFTAKRLLTDNALYAPLFKKVDVPKDKRWNQKLIHSQVSQGILQGESIGKIADRIQNVTDANRASAIRNARTMCTTAENTGRMDSFKDAEKMGIVGKKVWLSTWEPGRTRKWHLDLYKKKKDINEPFRNEKGDIMYPGDPNASAANIYNCRCTTYEDVIGFRTKDGSVIKIADFM